MKINTMSIIHTWESISKAERKLGYKSPNVKFTGFRLGILQHTNPILIDNTRLYLVPSIEGNCKIRKLFLDENLYRLLFYLYIFLKG